MTILKLLNSLGYKVFRWITLFTLQESLNIKKQFLLKSSFMKGNSAILFEFCVIL